MTQISKTSLNKALFAHQSGDLKKAEKLYRKFIAIAPNDSNVLHLLGAVCHENGNLDQAKQYLNRSIKLAPNSHQALNTRGIFYKETGQIMKAEQDFRAALDLEADFPEALTNLADTCRLTGNIEEAEKLNDRAINLAPNLAPAHNNRGTIERELGNLQKAKMAFQTALGFDNNLIDAAINLAIIQKMLGQTDIALETALNTVRKSPNYAPANNCLGMVYFDLGKYKDAEKHFNNACSIDPDYAHAQNNLANALTRLDQNSKAQNHYEIALSLEPKNPDFWANKAASLQAENRIREVIKACNNALRFAPNHPDARWNRAIAFLISGNLLRGFADYESRWFLPEFKRRSFDSKLWKGQNLKNKSILLHSEQGFGDTIQFIRYVTLITKQEPKNIYIETHKPLFELLKQIPEIEKVFVRGDKLPKIDYQIPLMSLANLFKTTLNSIPKSSSYIKNTKISPYKFENNFKSKKIGICWAGRPTHKNDHKRSIPLSLCIPFLKMKNTQFYSLQLGKTEDYKDNSQHLIDLSDHLTDFAATGAILQNLDLVITVDTAVAHLAGSLGVKCWVMLPFAPDWRWLLNRNKSPWYASITLFRQNECNDWKNVISEIKSSLEKFISEIT